MHGASGFFSWKRQDAIVLGRLDDAELGGVLARCRDGGDGDFGALFHVVLDHAGDIHAIDVIAAEDGHHVRVGLLHQVDVLVDGVRRPLVPGFVLAAHLRRHRNHELVFQEAAELPALVEMLQQALAAELGQHVDGVDSRVDEVAQHEIDDPVFAAERNGRFGPLISQGRQPGALTAGEDDAEYAYPHKF